MSVLDAGALLAEAEAKTGLADYGDPTLPDRFAILIGHMRAAGMDAAGEAIAAEEALAQLCHRLRFFGDRACWPIAEEPIVAPVFATGEPRSGTTLLHMLLSLDPEARSLRFWELMHPSPPPGLATTDDPRRAQADAEWREILQRIPKWLVNHPYNDMLGDGLAECERAWGFDFRVMGPTVWWRVPMRMIMAGLPADAHAQYRLHRMMLQHCQYARPRKRWVLKGFHSGRLGAMFDTYPDATLVWTHRDPVQVIASRIVMAGELDEGLTGRVDWAETARHYLALSRANIAAALASPFLDDPRVHHIRYRDFVADPVGTIEHFHQRAGLGFSEAHRTAMHDYLANNRSDRYGKFRYALDVIGEDIDALHAEFAPYRARFGIEIEQQGAR
ncbi:MAG: sulfotransferase [Sphingomonadales bacterium]|nr:sulfotransferase [Sphingomonadales bacterium]